MLVKNNINMKQYWLKLISVCVYLFCSVGSTNSSEPVDSVKFLTQYSSVIMRNLESHINITEDYLEENKEFVTFATATLSSLSKSVQTLRKNVGLGDIPSQDFRESLNILQKQVREVNSEQKRQREATTLLSMKVDLILQTIISLKGTPTSAAGQDGKDNSKLDNILHHQKGSSSAIQDLKKNLESNLDSKNSVILKVSRDIATYSSEAKKDRKIIQDNIKHIKSITDENFMILREELKNSANCATAQPQTKIYHIPQPVTEASEPLVTEEEVEPQQTVKEIAGGSKEPKIESATSFINIDLLKDFEARILVSGNPEPIITWSSGSTCNDDPEHTITSGGRYTVVNTEMAPGLYAASLKISTFKHEDANLCYFITANNSAGTVSSTVILAPKSQMQDCSGSYQKVSDVCLDLLSLWSPWEVSKAECQALGGELIQHTDFEIMFSMLDTWPAIKLAEKRQKFWVGARKSHSDQWALINGTELIIPDHLWAKGEPNESGQCLMVDIGVKEWRVWDAPCDSQRQAICKMS